MTSSGSPLFQGCATALVTPMKNGGIDKSAYERLLHTQLEAGVNALVVSGTTGESPTLTDREKRYLYTQAVKAVEESGKKIPVIAGTGSNNTARAAEISRMAEDAGCDGLLVVTPYYNKASEAGLISHFLTVTDAVSLPVILYHVPARTGCAMSVNACRVLSQHPRVVGLKDATGNIGFTARVSHVCGDALPIYSGNDDAILPILALGGVGAISVVSNLFPATVVSLCDAWRAGHAKEAADIQKKLLPLCDALFCEVNPIPVKAAMELRGLCRAEVRLPLAPADERLRARLEGVLEAYGEN